MRPDLLLAHTELTRRDALGLAGKAAATAALAGAGVTAATATAEPAGAATRGATYDDTMFDVRAVEAGEWAPTRYGAGDQRGSFNEVTPATTARALRLLANGRPVKTYNLGDLMTNGFPAYKTAPPRILEQRLLVEGFRPDAAFFNGGGLLKSPTPIGANRVSVLEERFPEGYTYQLVTQLDNLNHIGVGEVFYNGFRGPEIAKSYGTSKLGNEHMGPIVTRGVLLDVLGLKLARGDRAALSRSKAGRPILRDDYRIRLEDLTAAAAFGRIRRINPGDVVLIRTGWNQVARSEPDRYVAKEPGIYLREARFLASFRPAIIGADNWALEVLGNPVVTAAFPVHQELLVKHGIRIGEGIITDELARDRVYEFVYITTPQYAKGATAGNAPPAALGQPRR